jgi:hypothetical protein
MTDRLQQMYDTQRDLQERVLGHRFDDMTTVERITYVKEMVLALTDELHELLNETGWKSWSTSRHINEIAYRSELVDSWHFLLNLMLAVGMTPDELYSGYAAKRAVNEQRQASGYTGEKCPGCGRAVDDPGWDHHAIVTYFNDETNPSQVRCRPVTRIS